MTSFLVGVSLTFSINNKEEEDNMIRKISPKKLCSFQKRSGKHVQTNDIAHMVVGDSLDSTKAHNICEHALFEVITMDPRRRNEDETNQVKLMDNSFDGHRQLKRSTKFLVDGIIYNAGEEIPSLDPSDLDGQIVCGNNKAYCTYKTTTGNGTAQKRQFKDVEKLIHHSPDINSIEPGLCVFISGDYWIKKRHKFAQYRKEYKFDTFKELLTQIAKGKKVLVMSDDDLPAVKCDFFDKYEWMK